MSWVHAVIDVPAELHAATAEFWQRVSGWPVGAPWPDHPELRSFEPPSGRPYLHVQQINGPPRVHLDIESDDPDQAFGRALELGAELVGEHDRWRALRSPGGLVFCVLPARPHEPAQPATFPDGHRARLVQVCSTRRSGFTPQRWHSGARYCRVDGGPQTPPNSPVKGTTTRVPRCSCSCNNSTSPADR